MSFQEDGTYLKSYKKHEDVNPGFEEVFLFHNRGKAHYSSCGALAWQVRARQASEVRRTSQRSNWNYSNQNARVTRPSLDFPWQFEKLMC